MVRSSYKNHGISSHQINRLLKPSSIAIIGVSTRKNSAGRNVFNNLKLADFKGSIHLVTRDGSDIEGRPSVSSIDDLPAGIDVAIFTLPNKAIVKSVEACIHRQMAAIMCFASGFADVGVEGQVIQDRITTLCYENDIAFAGPNCLGLINFVDNIPITFPPVKLYTEFPKRVGVLTQSGAMMSVLRIAMASKHIGCTYAISTGNEAVLSIEDYMPFLIENEQTHILVMLVEQIRNPQIFLQHAKSAYEVGKPIVMLHLGSSDRARESVKTHTGALTGDYTVMQTFVKSEKVVLVDTLDELIDTATVLAYHRHSSPRGVGIVTDSGAFKAFALDYCETVNLDIPDLGSNTERALTEILPDFSKVSNPVDLTGVAMFDPSMYTRTVKALLEDPDIGYVFASLLAGSPKIGLERIRHLIRGIQDSHKQVICAFMGENQDIETELKPVLSAANVPYFSSPQRAMRALSHVQAFALYKQQEKNISSLIEVKTPKLPNTGTIVEYHSKRILADAGLPVPEGQIVRSFDEAVETAQRIGFPVALKLQSYKLLHKTDIDGLVLNIPDIESLQSAWKDLTGKIAFIDQDISSPVMLVEAMCNNGIEMIVGARRDPEWGSVLLIGFGGILAEVIDDIQILPANSTQEQIVAAINKLEGAKLLKGFRGRPVVDVEAFAEAVARVGALIRATPQLEEVDINPLAIYPDGVLVLDALMIVNSS